MSVALLDIVEHLPGQRLVLQGQASGSRLAKLSEACRGLGAELAAGARGLLQGVKLRRATLRERVESAGVVALLLVCGALLLLAAALALVGLVLVFVLYVMGAWLAAWWWVREAARAVARRSGDESALRTTITRLVGTRGSCVLTLLSGRVVEVALSSERPLRALIEQQAGGPCLLALVLSGAEDERIEISFSVRDVDDEAEAVDLCLRLARALGLQSYLADRYALLGVTLDCFAAPAETGGSHPFRGLAVEPRVLPIPAIDQLPSYDNPRPPAGFRPPPRELGPFEPGRWAGGRFSIERFEPGRIVEVKATPRLRPLRVLQAQLIAALVSVATLLTVTAPIALAQGSIALRAPDGRSTLLHVFGVLTAGSVACGLLASLSLWWTRFGRCERLFDWRTRELTIRDDERANAIPFAEVHQVVLLERCRGRRSFVVELLCKGHAPLRLLEVDAALGDEQAYLPALSFTVELARALDKPWRCVAAPSSW